jgi:hypothetical protein
MIYVDKAEWNDAKARVSKTQFQGIHGWQHTS